MTDLADAAQIIVDGEVICLECLNPIDPARVAAMPGVTRCLECQRAVEREEGFYGV